MTMSSRRSIILCVLLAVGLSACGTTDPYVFTPNEFDRELDTFREKPEDLALVTICYNKWDTTPEKVLELASVECGKYGKIARSSDQEFGVCPLLVPMAAYFACVKP